MVFKAKSPKINIEEVRALSKLEGAALARKINVIRNWKPSFVGKTSVFSW